MLRAAVPALLVVSFVLGACATGPPGHVRIGVVAPLSGPRAFLGQEVVDGARLAVEDLNDAGGLLGEPVELVVRDDSDLVDLPGQLADLAERDRVSAVIGPEAPGVLLGPRSPLSRRGIPAVLPTAFGGDLSEAATPVLRTVPSARDQAEALGRWLADVRRLERVALLVADPVEGQVVGRSVEDGLTAGGVGSVTVLEAEGGAADLTPAVVSLRDAVPDADAVVVWGPPPVAASAVRAIRGLGWEVQTAVPASSFVGEFRTLAGDASEGTVLPFPFREEWFTAEMEDWLVRWYREHGLSTLPQLDTLVLDLPVGALAAYDAVGLVAAAVEAAATREPSAVADALDEVTHDGLLREYGFDGREAWDVDDLHIARFHHFAVVYDVDPDLDAERQRRFYRYQVELGYLPDAVVAGPAGQAIRDAVAERRRDAPPYRPPLPPPGPVRDFP